MVCQSHFTFIAIATCFVLSLRNWKAQLSGIRIFFLLQAISALQHAVLDAVSHFQADIHISQKLASLSGTFSNSLQNFNILNQFQILQQISNICQIYQLIAQLNLFSFGFLFVVKRQIIKTQQGNLLLPDNHSLQTWQRNS